jgi:hypothetical protein
MSLAGIGQTTQLTATATFGDGATRNVTANATWQSSNSGLATVSGGLVTAVAGGIVTVTATYQGQSAAATIVMPFGMSPRSTMIATIDGTSFNAVSVSTLRTQVPSPSGLLTVGGTSGFASPYLVVTLAVPAVVGTYQLGPGTVSTASLQQNSPNSSILWDTLAAGGSGSITVTALTSTGATGSFTVTLVPHGGVNGTPTGTKQLTNGAFDVTF